MAPFLNYCCSRLFFRPWNQLKGNFFFSHSHSCYLYYLCLSLFLLYVWTKGFKLRLRIRLRLRGIVINYDLSHRLAVCEPRPFNFIFSFGLSAYSLWCPQPLSLMALVSHKLLRFVRVRSGVWGIHTVNQWQCFRIWEWTETIWEALWLCHISRRAEKVT